MVKPRGGVKAVPAKEGAVPRHRGSVTLTDRRITAQSLLCQHPFFHLTQYVLPRDVSPAPGNSEVHV